MALQKNRISFNAIELSVLWSRLISLVDEAGTTLQRTAFSSVTRESADFAVVLMDTQGQSLAQSSVSVPSFLGVMPFLVKALIKHFFPLNERKPGDVVIITSMIPTATPNQAVYLQNVTIAVLSCKFEAVSKALVLSEVDIAAGCRCGVWQFRYSEKVVEVAPQNVHAARGRALAPLAVHVRGGRPRHGLGVQHARGGPCLQLRLPRGWCFS
jgi:hypothetical protein